MHITNIDMLFRILEWTSAICFHQIHYFRNDTLLFSTLEMSFTANDILENPFRCDPNLFSSLIHFADENEEDADGEKPSAYLLPDGNEPDICYGILTVDQHDRLIIGPVALRRLSAMQLRGYIRNHHIKDYKNYYIRTGALPQLSAMISLLSYILTGKTENPQLSFHHEGESTDPMRLQKYQLDNSELGIQHLPYKIEDYFMSCIRDGDQEAFELMLDSYQSYSVGTMSESALKQEEYGSVVSVSLMARAAIEGGVNPYYAYDMNDLYLQQISSAKTKEEYIQIATKASKAFIRAVNQNKAQQSQSVYTEKCKQYIVRHLNSRFTLDDLAETIGLNRTYISGLFRQYEGMTLTEYTHRERINAAQNMLRFSDYKLAQIAEYFCFHSQSHFGRIFKKYTGMTPQQYRRQKKSSSF